MPAHYNSPDDYIQQMAEDKKAAFQLLRHTIVSHLPEGFSECMAYGMISYVVPHSLYPAGYHCNPKTPLPFVSIAAQKNGFSLHHLGLYGNKELLDWFLEEYPKHSQHKLDMGKGCVRFKNTNSIPLDLIAMLIKKISVEDWIAMYEHMLKKNK